MKNIIAISISLLFINVAQAQKLKTEDVPTVVKESFSKKYPNTKAKWEKEKDNYEAEFDWNKVESSAIFSASGEYIELEQEIKLSELPEGVAEYCTKNFIGFKMEEAEKIVDANGKISFEVEMEKGKEKFDVIFDDNGNFIHRSTEESDKED